MNKTNQKNVQWWYELKDLWNKFDPKRIWCYSEDGSELFPDYDFSPDEYDSYIAPTFTRLENGENFDQLNAWVSYIAKNYIGMSELSDEYIAEFVRTLQEWYAHYKTS